MTYQVTVKQLGQTVKQYDGIESTGAGEAIDRIIRQHYADYAIEYNNELVVIGYEFTARQLRMWLS